MNLIGREAQIIGYQAERRVASIATDMGYTVENGGTADFSNKTDLFIEGKPVQVSAKPKSKKTQAGLMKRGIFPIAAGPKITDEEIQNNINLLLEP